MPCLHMARLRRVGLVRPLVRDNAEWLSALLVHARIKNRICGIIRLRARGGSGRGGIDPEGLKVRGSGQQYFFCHHPILLIFFINVSVLREGVCRETRGGHNPPAPHPSRTTLLGRGSWEAAPPRVPIGRGAGIVEHRQIEK